MQLLFIKCFCTLFYTTVTTSSNFAPRRKGRGREVGADEGEGSQQSTYRKLVFRYTTSGRIKQIVIKKPWKD